MDGERYVIDEQRIVSEVIGGEAIVINLANGYYYSLDATAAEVWQAVDQGRSVSEIVSALQSRYDCSGADPEPSVRALITAWRADDLIVPAAPDAPPAGDPPSAAAGSEARPLFSPPSFQRFTDMQGFLLVDPIHEVDERGWPNVGARGSAPLGGG
jgi:hypothetical protein